MQRLINFVRETYPTVELPNGNQVHLVTTGGDYAMVIITSPQGYINMMDKLIYNATKGKYVRIHLENKKHVRVYLHQFEEDI